MAQAAVTVKLSIPDFYKVIKVMGDMRPVFADLGAEVLKEVGRTFEQQGIWAKWAPLRPNTMAGRRAGSSSKALQASGRLRASFRMQPMKSLVRVGSPLQVAQYHEEGRGEPAGGKGWWIKPIHGKALAFPVAAGGRSIGSMGRALAGKGMGLAIARDWGTKQVGGAKIPTAGMKVIRFKSYGHQKRSLAHLKRAKMAVVQKVYHPGYPARKMLPTAARALEIAKAVVTKWLETGGKK